VALSTNAAIHYCPHHFVDFSRILSLLIAF